MGTRRRSSRVTGAPPRIPLSGCLTASPPSPRTCVAILTTVYPAQQWRLYCLFFPRTAWWRIKLFLHLTRVCYSSLGKISRPLRAHSSPAPTHLWHITNTPQSALASRLTHLSNPAGHHALHTTLGATQFTPQGWRHSPSLPYNDPLGRCPPT